MHELPIVEATVKQVLEIAGQKKAVRVKRVVVCLGELSGFVDESIEFYWSIVAENTIAARAKLEVRRQRGKMSCLACNHMWGGRERPDTCPKCGSHKLTIVGGGGYVLESVEIE